MWFAQIMKQDIKTDSLRELTSIGSAAEMFRVSQKSFMGVRNIDDPIFSS
jgi:hypothetical protein